MSNELYAFAKAVSLIALYITAFSFGMLVFAFIDKAFPDPLEFYRSSVSQELTTALAAIIIAFPLYLFLMRLLSRVASKKAALLQSKVAKWLTYITLVVVAAIIIGDFIAVLASLLQGQLTGRFILKALTILAIAGSIFGYYLWSLQKEEKNKPTTAKVFAGVVAVVIVLAVVYGLTFVGSPASQRSIQFDERRVADLQQITFGVDEYWEQNEVLPEELQDLQDVRAFVRSIADPKTGEPYEYRIVEDRTYELCAVFENDSSAMQEKLPKKPFSEQSWDHGVGHTCFEHEAQEFTKELVPVPAR